MTMPFFTLVTPVYNIERLIGATIDSALSQTFTDWEMILVDDGSPDNAGAICDAYAKKYTQIKVVHKINEGLAEARNVGIRNAKGRYIIIYEGSDIFPSVNTLKNIESALSKADFPDIMFARLQDQLEGTGKITNEQKPYILNEYKGLYGMKLLDILIRNEELLATSAPVNKVYRRQFIIDQNIWFYKGIYHDDDEWLPRAIALTKSTLFTNEIIYSALTWDGCFGKIKSERGIAKKAIDKMFIAAHCCNDFNIRFAHEVTPAVWDYLVRFYISGAASLNILTEKQYIDQVKKAAKDYASALNYGLKSGSRNMKLLALVNFLLGSSIAVKLIQKRYRG